MHITASGEDGPWQAKALKPSLLEEDALAFDWLHQEGVHHCTELASKLTSPDERAFVERVMNERRRMNAGERIEGKIKTTSRQIVENIEDGLRLGRPQRRAESDSSRRES